MLKEVAGRMAASCRGGDLLGRVGGEEFLAVFADVTRAEAAAIAERLREAVARAPVLIAGGEALAVSVSGGLIALAPAEASALSEALSRADAALYRAKAEGRNRIVAADRRGSSTACNSRGGTSAARYYHDDARAEGEGGDGREPLALRRAVGMLGTRTEASAVEGCGESDGSAGPVG